MCHLLWIPCWTCRCHALLGSLIIPQRLTSLVCKRQLWTFLTLPCHLVLSEHLLRDHRKPGTGSHRFLVIASNKRNAQVSPELSQEWTYPLLCQYLNVWVGFFIVFRSIEHLHPGRALEQGFTNWSWWLKFTAKFILLSLLQHSIFPSIFQGFSWFLLLGFYPFRDPFSCIIRYLMEQTPLM